jgi:D-serine deaminase-like pyridoxal phosphate-dependent protein
MESLCTPALILDERRLAANIARVHAAIDRHAGVSLRPHFKTMKCVEIAERVFHGKRQATVSTLREAECLCAAGVFDILYAVGISPDKLPAIGQLQDRGARVGVVLDDLEVARALADWAASAAKPLPVSIEIDTDGHRAGVKPDSTQLVPIAEMLANARGVEFVGVMTHAGASYECRTTSDIIRVAEKERSGAVQAAERIRTAGLACRQVSVGSTPTILFAESLAGVTEARVGVAYFNDLTMVGLGVCSTDDVAVSVLTTVIGHQPSRNRLLVDAGWMALSADHGRASQMVFKGYGLVTDLRQRVLPHLGVLDTNQEHGLIGPAGNEPIDFARFPIGSRLRILPNHACATAAAFGEYHVAASDGELVARWQRCSGW